MKEYVIYLAKSPSGKKYVGITDDFNVRKINHLSKARNGSNFQFHQALRKYEDEIDWKIIDTAKNKSEACKKEIDWIDKLGTYKNGYNMTRGGQMTSPKAKEGTRRYIAKTENKDKRAKECGQKTFLVFKHKGSFVGEFVNVKRFCRENNIDRRNFKRCLSGRKEYVEGFVPFYKEDFKEEKLKNIVKKLKNTLKYIQFEVYKTDGEFIGKWNKVNDCCRELGLHKGNVSRCLKGERKTHKGYKFRLLNNKEN